MKIKNSIIHDYINLKSKKLLDEDEDDYYIKNMKNKISKTSTFIGDLEEFLDLEQKDIDKKIEIDDKMEFIIDKAKKELGVNATEEELENYIKLNQDKENIFENNELNDLLSGGPKGEEVLDQGAGYGELNEFDFEDGDGFNYTEEDI